MRRIGQDAAMVDGNRGERLQIMLTEEELRALDDWRFQHRMPSRAAAVRELLKRGLAAEGFLSADAGAQSKRFGVTGLSRSDGVAPSAQPDANAKIPGDDQKS